MLYLFRPILWACFCVLATQANGADLTFYVEEDPPVIARQLDGSLSGRVGSYIESIRRESRLTIETEFLPWNREVEAVDEAANRCVMPMARTAAREAKYVWIGPLYETKFALFGRPDTKIQIPALTDLSGSPDIVGVELNEAAHTLIKALPNVRIDAVVTARQNARKLSAGRIDLWASAESTARDYAKDEKVQPFKQVLTLPGIHIDIACNQQTDLGLITKLTEAYRRIGPLRSLPVNASDAATPN